MVCLIDLFLIVFGTKLACSTETQDIKNTTFLIFGLFVRTVAIKP